MEFSFGSSPSEEIAVSQFDPASFPQFAGLDTLPGRAGEFFAIPEEEAGYSVVIENLSERDITGLRYQWLITSANGKLQTSRMSSDSYYTLYRPVLKPGDRKLVSLSKNIDESTLEHLRSGGGIMGGGVGSGRTKHPLENAIALRFEIDAVIFSDGEVAGEDKGRYPLDLAARKHCAEFVAKHVRAAMSEGRDPTPVLKALAEIPHLRDDVHAGHIQKFARDMLRSWGSDEWREPRLRHFETLQELPKFYRKDGK